ncbi:MAG: hypothetical protein IKO07_03380 [Clostridia bacterium]|nr:hypothetical protein [Clostridia bacterium]
MRKNLFILAADMTISNMANMTADDRGFFEPGKKPKRLESMQCVPALENREKGKAWKRYDRA